MDPRVERRVSELLALTDFGVALTEPLSGPETASLIVLVAMGETGARWAELLLADGSGTFTSAARRPTSGAASGSSDGHPPFRLAGPLPEATVIRLAGGAGDEADAKANANEARLGAFMRRTGAAASVLLRSGEELRGILLLGPPHPGFAGSRSDFLEALAVYAAAALERCRRDEELHATNRSLSLNVYQLRSLMDLAAGLHRARDEGAVWDLLLNGAMGHVLATRGVVIAEGRVIAARGPRRPDEDWSRLARTAASLGKLSRATAVDELADADLVRDLEGLQMGWTVPVASGALRATLFLGTAGTGRELAEAEREFLDSLAGQAAAAAEGLRLTRASIAKEQELAAARSIQARLLPRESPQPEGWDIAGINIPCLEVGGDAFDYLAVDDGLFLTIADVSGKGAGPALIMASVQASLRACYGYGHQRLDEAVSALNDFLHAHTEDSRYMTGILSRLEPANGRFDYVNAGHVHPVLVREDGGVERLAAGSTVLGLFPRISIEIGRLRLARGDVLAMFTDGLTEAENPAGDVFDEWRIVDVLSRSRERSASEICGELLTLARAFAGANRLHDDLTLIVVKRKGVLPS